MTDIYLTPVSTLTLYQVSLPREQIVAIWEYDRTNCRGGRAKDSISMKLKEAGVEDPRIFQQGDVSVITFDLPDTIDTPAKHEEIKKLLSQHRDIAVKWIQR